MNIFFIDIPDQKFFLFQNLLVFIHSYSCSHSIWTSFSHDWKTLFVKLHTEPFIGANCDNDIRDFYRRKIWQRHEYFFYRQPRSKTILFQNILKCIQYYSSPHSIWTCPYLDWKVLLVKLHTEPFIGTKFDNDLWDYYSRKIWQRNEYFLHRHPRSKFFLFQSLLVCIHSYSSSHSIWTGFSHDWKTLFVKLHTEPFIGANCDNDFRDFYRRKIWQWHEYFFIDSPDQKPFCFRTY